MLDLDAAIEPGVGAAGLRLGDEVAQILALHKPDSSAKLPGSERTRHDFGPISIWEARGRVEQIRLSEGYRGMLDGIIGIGSTIAEVERHFGRPVEEAEEDELVVQDFDGWCFETEGWALPSGTPRDNSSARVTKLFVFGASPVP